LAGCEDHTQRLTEPYEHFASSNEQIYRTDTDLLWLKVTKAAEPRHQNHTRTLFIAPQKMWPQPHQPSASKINK
jgi:hypothetical protein